MAEQRPQHFKGYRGYLQPEAVMVHCGRKPQHLNSREWSFLCSCLSLLWIYTDAASRPPPLLLLTDWCHAAAAAATAARAADAPTACDLWGTTLNLSIGRIETILLLYWFMKQCCSPRLLREPGGQGMTRVVITHCSMLWPRKSLTKTQDFSNFIKIPGI